MDTNFNTRPSTLDDIVVRPLTAREEQRLYGLVHTMAFLQRELRAIHDARLSRPITEAERDMIASGCLDSLESVTHGDGMCREAAEHELLDMSGPELLETWSTHGPESE